MEIPTEQLQFIMNHIAVTNDELGGIQVDIAILKTQMASVVWWFRAIVGAFIVLIVGQIYQINKLRKNGNNKK